jgi:hypothetical protein
MSNLTDHQFGMVAETTYGTPVTVTRFLRLLGDGSEHDFDPMPLQGVGLQVSAPGGVDRSDRRVPGIGKGTLGLKFEAESKGLGLLLSHALGTATSTLVSGSTYQQVITPTVTGTVLPSSTMQVGVVNNAGTAKAYTYAGCTIGGWEFELPESGIATWKVDVDAKSLATATSLATASYASSPSMFTYANTASLKVGGTLTVPTTTALASSSGSANLNIRALTCTSVNSIDDGRWIPGGRNQPTVGKRTHKLKLTYEYSDDTFRDILLTQAATSLLLDLQTTEALSTGFAGLQLAIPAAKVSSGAIPKPSNGETVVSDIELDILWDGTNQPLYVVGRTADTAL